MLPRILSERPMLVVIANYWGNIGLAPEGAPTSPAAWREALEGLVTEGLVTLEDVTVVAHRYREPGE